MAESKNPFEIDFDSYILQSEPEQQENGKLWQTAIGLQQVDGVTQKVTVNVTVKFTHVLALIRMGTGK